MENKIQGLRILLRFSTIHKVYSVVIPETWKIEQLNQFIHYAFKDDLKGKEINIYFGAKLISNHKQLVKDFYNNNDLVQFIVTVKKLKNQENDKSQFYKSQNKQELVNFHFYLLSA